MIFNNYKGNQNIFLKLQAERKKLFSPNENTVINRDKDKFGTLYVYCSLYVIFSHIFHLYYQFTLFFCFTINDSSHRFF